MQSQTKNNTIMKRHDLLLPYKVKTVGWVILGMGTLLWAAWWLSGGRCDFSVNSIRSMFGMPRLEVGGYITGLSSFCAETELVSTIARALILLGAYLAGFSRCKDEDEFTEHLRYRALTATVVGLMAAELLVVAFCYGTVYLMTQHILVTVSPMFYVLYFHLLAWRERRRNEE